MAKKREAQAEMILPRHGHLAPDEQRELMRRADTRLAGTKAGREALVRAGKLRPTTPEDIARLAESPGVKLMKALASGQPVPAPTLAKLSASAKPKAPAPKPKAKAKRASGALKGKPTFGKIPEKKGRVAPPPGFHEKTGADGSKTITVAPFKLKRATPAKKPTWPSPLEPGVYFGLPAALHHADAALGSGDIRRLLIGAPEYWYDSPLNPERPPYEPTKPQEFGTAMHKLVVEGPAAFKEAYEEPPDPEGLLITDDDIAQRLADLGDADPPRRKSDKIVRLLELQPDAKIKDVITERAKAAGRTVLAHEEYTRIVQGALLLSHDDEYRDAFTGGQAEPTIVYDRPDGVRCKARIDFLKPRANVELKTIGNTRGMSFKRAVLSQIWNYRYDLQAEHYAEGRRQLPELIRKGAIFGKVDRDWLKLFDHRQFATVLIFFASQGAPIHWGMKLSPGNSILQIARDHIEAAIEAYKKHMSEFGPKKMWLMREPLAELDLNDFPSFAYR